MFYSPLTQEAFDFAVADLRRWRALLIGWRGDPLPVRRRSPLGQLVRSIISARTRDAVSTAAYDRLAACCPALGAMAGQAPGSVERIIADVTFAADKAAYLVAAMRMIAAERPDHGLEFLGRLPMRHALAWLERLPGVARKVSASTLNASTLGLPVFIVDTHVLRVLRRLGFGGARADYRGGSEAVTAAAACRPTDDLLRLHILAKRLGRPSAAGMRPIAHAARWRARAGRRTRAERLGNRRTASDILSMNLISILIGLFALAWALLAFVPLFGWMYWLILPIALAGLGAGLLSSRRGGRNLNLLVILVGAIRLAIGHGIL